ncbi:RNA polymerase sigma factor [Pseudotenacibaculum haliotis]|uniref:RNA polymerase sigma factor n=1 Tax=Pseudotenacibaculum haliotis TaxID=1862138 RepID=A0ABW5LU81_9FLAO
MNTLSDNSLMLRVKEGDVQKLGLLYERYKKRLFGFFYQMNRNADLSEDLVQNVFMKILKYKHTYTEESNFVVWVFQIARNTSYDSFKKNKASMYKDIDDVGHLINANDDIHGSIAKRENMITLKRAIEMLSPEQKELIVLSKFKELKYKELGEIVGCTEGNARIKVHRALNQLKDIFLTLEKR